MESRQLEILRAIVEEYVAEGVDGAFRLVIVTKPGLTLNWVLNET